VDFDKNSLNIDAEAMARDLADKVKTQLRSDLKKDGAIIGISGGIDSSVVASLCINALGSEKVLGIMMPEKESSGDSRTLAEKLARTIGIESHIEDITAPLEGLNCYQRRDEAIRRVFPEYDSSYKTKITIASNILERDGLNYFKLTIESPDGESKSKRMPRREYLDIVAASNMKQRLRMTMLYYHAERRNWAVVGTANKNEHDLGFFVKHGDGGVDLQPIAHLYKMQIFQLARALDIPDEIIGRVPTTDTYSAEVTQTEFFFGVDFDLLDPIWYAMELGISAQDTAKALGLEREQVERICRDIKQKGRTTEYLRKRALKYAD
jgi:NAD+ synthase